jgi:uncharacterized protein (DUF4415 family)
MSKRTPLTDAQGEVRELTAADLARFKPAQQALPAKLYEELVNTSRRAGVRGPQKAPLKKPTTIRLDADVLAALKATGDGWQTRLNEMVRASLRMTGQI